jgi:hypothetical protein
MRNKAAYVNSTRWKKESSDYTLSNASHAARQQKKSLTVVIWEKQELQLGLSISSDIIYSAQSLPCLEIWPGVHETGFRIQGPTDAHNPAMALATASILVVASLNFCFDHVLVIKPRFSSTDFIQSQK